MIKLRKSANEILKLFQDQKQWTQDEIENSLPNFHKDDIKYSLRKLNDKGIVVKIPNLRDMRRVYHRIATQDEFSETFESRKMFNIKFYQSISRLISN
ncbi:MAG: hypothetical protein HeimC2_32710 [Candidatus Heimdallarchaeota archaeon LC_2]|nr:MAG: hypothetical protein HeimC2_32710 [Candidatus Heimdallarchaeota archaeon LC_2]